MKRSLILHSLSLVLSLAALVGMQQSARAAGVVVLWNAPKLVAFAGIGGAIYVAPAMAMAKARKGKETPSEKDTTPGSDSHGNGQSDPRYGDTDRGGSRGVGEDSGSPSYGGGGEERGGGGGLFRTALLVLGADEEASEAVSTQAHLKQLVELQVFSAAEAAEIAAEMANKVAAHGSLMLDMTANDLASMAARNGVSSLTAEYLMTLRGVN